MLNLQKTLNLAGKLLLLDRPLVMGVLNATPDSFYAKSRFLQKEAVEKQVQKMVQEGVDILDIGGMSSRPGAAIISEAEEMDRVLPVIEWVQQLYLELPISIDTVRAGVAKAAVTAGASLVNDISSGSIDEQLLETVAALRVPYILMHMQGLPATMQDQPSYGDVTKEILEFSFKKYNCSAQWM